MSQLSPWCQHSARARWHCFGELQCSPALLCLHSSKIREGPKACELVIGAGRRGAEPEGCRWGCGAPQRLRAWGEAPVPGGEETISRFPEKPL